MPVLRLYKHDANFIKNSDVDDDIGTNGSSEMYALASSTQANTIPDDFMVIKHASGSVVSGSEQTNEILGLFNGGPHIKQDSLMLTVEEGKVDFD